MPGKWGGARRACPPRSATAETPLSLDADPPDADPPAI